MNLWSILSIVISIAALGVAGKVERSIPGDDPRNPAVIADTVGDPFKDSDGLSINTQSTVALRVK